MLTHRTLNNLSPADLSAQDLATDWPQADLPDPAADPAAPEFASGAVPRPAAAAPSQVLYLTEPGDTTAISVNDIHQGQIGDCFLLSSIGELALYHPSSIASMIHANANGTETVTLYGTRSGTTPGFGATAFAPRTETVTNSFAADGVNSGAGQDVVNGQKEIWVQVLEKAYAEANGGVTAGGEYAGIRNGGNPCLALEQLTGHTATWQSPASLSVAKLAADQAAGDLIVMDTASRSDLPYGLVGSHAYMFEGLKTVAGTASVQLGNPWGFDQPGLIPVASLSKGIVEVDIGHW